VILGVMRMSEFLFVSCVFFLRFRLLAFSVS